MHPVKQSQKRNVAAFFVFVCVFCNRINQSGSRKYAPNYHFYFTNIASLRVPTYCDIENKIKHDNSLTDKQKYGGRTNMSISSISVSGNFCMRSYLW